MAEKRKKHGLTHALSFKVLCGLAILFVLGVLYNFVVKEEPNISKEDNEVEEQRKAAQDTLDVVGDYLWPGMNMRKTDLQSDADKADEARMRASSETSRKPSGGKDENSSKDIKMPKIKLPPVPAPAADQATEVVTTGQVKSATKQNSTNPGGPTVEKLEAPRVERIE